jgi:hypothetical protein
MRFIGIFPCEFPSRQHVVSTLLLSCFDAIDIKIYNRNDKKKNIYGNATESFLSYQPKAWKQQHGEKIKWLNVQNVEKKQQSQKRHGKWLVVQTKLENECN